MAIKTKKGVMQYIAIAMAIGGSVISIAFYALVLTAIRDTQTAGTLFYNICDAGLNLFSGITTQFPTIGTIIGVMILAGVVLGGGMLAYMGYQKVKGVK